VRTSSGGDRAVVAADRDDVAGPDLRCWGGLQCLEHPKGLDHRVALPDAPSVAPCVVGDDRGAVAGEFAVLDQDALAQDLGVGVDVEQRQLFPGVLVEPGRRRGGQLLLVLLGPPAGPGDVRGLGCHAPL
jgi:hypothetical protein